jgi:2'-5' RNA ligase
VAHRNGHVKRLFIAVDVDESTRSAIAEIAGRLRERLAAKPAPGRMTSVPPERLHLTLEFLGAADEAVERVAIAALTEPMPIAPFSLTFGGVGFFPSRGSPRVVWLGISQGAAELRRVDDVLRCRLRDIPRRPEPFNPHLTLARVRDRMAPSDVAEISALRAVAGPSRIDRVTLYESRLSPKGPTYVVLAEGRLTS